MYDFESGGKQILVVTLILPEWKHLQTWLQP